MYEITAPHLDAFPEDIEEVYEDPRVLLNDLNRLRKLFPDMPFPLLKDGVPLAEDRLLDEIERFLVRCTLQDEDKVKTGYRPGWGGDSDLANGSRGRVGVWKPSNPED